MSEREGQQGGSPLESERGHTNVGDTVVKKIAGMAAQDVEGIHMGGGAARAASGLLSRAGSSSQDQTRGISVEVGRTETAIDITMSIDYGRNIIQTAGRVREVVRSSVESLTGLRIRELNVTISDVIFPENGGAGDSTGDEDDTRSMPSQEPGPGAREREYTEVSPSERTHIEGQSGPVPEEDVRVEGKPLEEDETAELRLDKEEPEGRGSSGGENEGERARRRDRPRES